MEQRFQILLDWLREIYPMTEDRITPASSDASHRRYFRFNWENHSYIVMDAPPDLENCAPFIFAQQQLHQVGMPVPEILRSDVEKGLLLLTDLGDETFLRRVSVKPEQASDWYLQALQLLVRMQKNSTSGVFPLYSEELLHREMSLFPDWFVEREKSVKLSFELKNDFKRAIDLIVANIMQQPRVWVHRDYHSRNLMIHNEKIGVIDFQDAVYGPITYDAVSLLRDAYIDWPEEQQLDWLIRYWQDLKKNGLPVSSDFYSFYKDFEMMGIQRHIKVVGIFARLAHRDNKIGYLQDIPRVWAYLKSAVSRYDELKPLMKVLNHLDQDQNELSKVGYTF